MNQQHLSADSYYVTWGARHSSGANTVPGQPLPPHGKPLGKLTSADLKDVIKKVWNHARESGMAMVVC